MSSAAMAHLLQLGRPDATPRSPATAETASLTPPQSHGPQRDRPTDADTGSKLSGHPSAFGTVDGRQETTGSDERTPDVRGELPAPCRDPRPWALTSVGSAMFTVTVRQPTSNGASDERRTLPAVRAGERHRGHRPRSGSTDPRL